MGGGCIDQSFLDLSTKWRLVVSFAPGPLTSGEKAHCTHWIGGWVGSRSSLHFQIMSDKYFSYSVVLKSRSTSFCNIILTWIFFVVGGGGGQNGFRRH
jgi:hypothetical protein